MMKNEDVYKEKVKEYTKKFANGNGVLDKLKPLASGVQSSPQIMVPGGFNSNPIFGSENFIDLDKSNPSDSLNADNKGAIHKISTDLEDSAIDEEELNEENLSNRSQLSDLSDTSGIENELDVGA